MQIKYYTLNRENKRGILDFCYLNTKIIMISLKGGTNNAKNKRV